MSLMYIIRSLSSIVPESIWRRSRKYTPSAICSCRKSDCWRPPTDLRSQNPGSGSPAIAGSRDLGPAMPWHARSPAENKDRTFCYEMAFRLGARSVVLCGFELEAPAYLVVREEFKSY